MDVEFRILNIDTAKTIIFELGDNVDFVGATFNHGSYTYNAHEHAIYWQVPAIFDGKHIIINLKPKKVSD